MHVYMHEHVCRMCVSYCITHLGRRAISDCITWVVVSVTEEPDSYSEVMKAVISLSSDEMRLTYSLSRGLKN